MKWRSELSVDNRLIPGTPIGTKTVIEGGQCAKKLDPTLFRSECDSRLSLRVPDGI